MASKPNRAEPMNATSHHPKVKVSLSFSSPLFIAGEHIAGKMEVECKADKGLGIGLMMVELLAVQELTSQNHHAISPFIQSRRVFQGPHTPPSNAVQPHPLPGDPPLPPHYYTARKGKSTFFFKIRTPKTVPGSVSFGDGIATVRYEVRGIVGVSWKGERRMVLEKKEVDVIESFEDEDMTLDTAERKKDELEGVVVAENGKIWIQARIVGGMVVAGESACVELQVKNHSSKKNAGLEITLNRELILPNLPPGEKQPAALQISDTLTAVPFRGPEYIIQPGIEGVASLVFDVPKVARGVKALTVPTEGGGKKGILIGEEDGKSKETLALFEIKCTVGLKMIMAGLGHKDIELEIPVPIVHPAALPSLPEDYAPPIDPYMQYQHPEYQPQHLYGHNPHYYQQQQQQLQMYDVNPSQSPYPVLPMSPGPQHPMSPQPMSPQPMSPQPYIDNGMVWLPPPQAYYPQLPVSPPPPSAWIGQIPQPSGTPAPPWIPQRPRSAGPGGGRESTRPLPMVPPVARSPPHVSSPTPPLPGLPPSSVRDVRQVSSGGEATSPPVASQPISVGADRQRGRKVSQVDLEHEQPTQETRASRIAHHLRITSTRKGRGRSASPVGSTLLHEETPLPPLGENRSYAVATLAHPGRKDMHIPMPPPLSATFDANSGHDQNLNTPLHSPRPILSPKQSFTQIKTLSNSGSQVHVTVKSKSERVEELERMADEVTKKTRDLSGDLPKEDSPPAAASTAMNEANINKTLPKLSPREEDYFAGTNLETATPATPTLNALTTHGAIKFKTGGKTRESGLDALEKRLLAEVGTKKVEDGKRPDVWSVLGMGERSRSDHNSDMLSPASIDKSRSPRTPVDIPAPRQDPVDPLNDSAISSLTLPDCDLGAPASTSVPAELVDRELLKMKKSQDLFEEEEDSKTSKSVRTENGKRREVDLSMASDGERKSSERKRHSKQKDKDRDSKHKDKDGSKHKDREEPGAKRKGKAIARVNAWLGAVENVDAPAEDAIVHFDTPSPKPSPMSRPTELRNDSSKSDNETEKGKNFSHPESSKEPEKAPHPTSSGFVPFGSLKPDIYQRTLVPKDSPLASAGDVEEDAKKIAEMWGIPKMTESPGSSPGRYDPTMKNPWLTKKGLRALGGVSNSPWKNGFPNRPADDEAKYDVRSARGGRGGKVTAVAQLWTAAANGKASSTSNEGPSERLQAPPKITSSNSSGSSAPTRKNTPTLPPSSTKPTTKYTSAALKSTPATITSSSSHAIPTLSSTASLALPVKYQQRRRETLPVKVPHTIGEVSTSNRYSLPATSPASASSPATKAPQSRASTDISGTGIKPGTAANSLKVFVEATHDSDKGKDKETKLPDRDMAFGQARLRDLIKKYQGQMQTAGS